MSGMPFVVGAYASMPTDAQEQEEYYGLLGEQNWISGAELPFPGGLADLGMLKKLSYMLPDHWTHNTVTAIPGTMKWMWADPAVPAATLTGVLPHWNLSEAYVMLLTGLRSSKGKIQFRILSSIPLLLQMPVLIR
mgnify:CR=1 FL=1